MELLSVIRRWHCGDPFSIREISRCTGLSRNTVPEYRSAVRVYPERIVVVAEGQIICEHRRVFARSHQRKWS